MVARTPAELYTLYISDTLTIMMSIFQSVLRQRGLVAIEQTGRLRVTSNMTRIALISAALVAGLASSTVLQAQSTGLKLGQEAPEQPKLDLGAAPRPQAQTATQPSTTVQSPTANAGGEVVTNGAWQVSCVPGADCAMAQIGNDGSGTPILEMVVRKLSAPLEADGRTAIAVIDFITPLGVVLTSGLELKIDSGNGEAAPFQICTEQGCLVREPVDKGLVDRLKKGSTAQVSVVAANQGNVTANISLSGFTKSFNSLQ